MAQTSVPTAARTPLLLLLLPGMTLAVAGGAVATALGTVVPLLGAPVLGVLLGAIGGRVLNRPATRAGVAQAYRVALPVAVVLLGARLSLGQVARVGGAAAPVMLVTLAVCLGTAAVLGGRLGISRDLRILIGVGTGICGASAIAAVTPVLRARNPDVSYALATIFLFNLAAVVTFPMLGHSLGLSQHAFGVFAGTAVNDTSSVVAAASAYGTGAAGVAVVVKLTRSLMIVPMCLALAARRQQPHTGTGRVPGFLIGFLLLATVNSVGLVPAALHAAIGTVATFLVSVALVTVGLSTDIAAIRRAGARPLLLGLVLWLAVSGTSLAVQGLGALL